ncbi:MAG: metallophosphoesterase [Bacteroidota bacterium]|nr:metallophosphoesterase [Bacteroidota bacterium]
MRISPFVIFFSIVLTVYGLINYYIFNHAIQAFPSPSRYTGLFTTLFVFLVVSYPAGRFLERVWQSWISDLFTWVGAFWLAAMFYFFLIVLVSDMISLTGWMVPKLPALLIHPTADLKVFYLYSSIGVVVLALVLGHINALHPRIRVIDIQTGKKALGPKEVSIVMASDIHLGTIIGPRRVGRLVNTINGLKPDLVVLAGDVVDEDLKPVIRQNLGEALRKISAPLGVYAITGNHEYIGGAEAACRYLENHGITMLRDSVVSIKGMFYLAGREDRSINSFAGKKRKTLNSLLAGLDRDRPIVLMDHQPFNLEEAERQHVTLQLSGHTHYGQIWPLNYIIDAIYELGMGYKTIGNTHYYVSPGYGSWGPPVRIGHRPEIALIRLRFE